MGDCNIGGMHKQEQMKSKELAVHNLITNQEKYKMVLLTS